MIWIKHEIGDDLGGFDEVRKGLPSYSSPSTERWGE
jgi:hypothetical protein